MSHKSFSSFKNNLATIASHPEFFQPCAKILPGEKFTVVRDGIDITHEVLSGKTPLMGTSDTVQGPWCPLIAYSDVVVLRSSPRNMSYLAVWSMVMAFRAIDMRIR